MSVKGRGNPALLAKKIQCGPKELPFGRIPIKESGVELKRRI